MKKTAVELELHFPLSVSVFANSEAQNTPFSEAQPLSLSELVHDQLRALSPTSSSVSINHLAEERPDCQDRKLAVQQSDEDGATIISSSTGRRPGLLSRNSSAAEIPTISQSASLISLASLAPSSNSTVASSTQTTTAASHVKGRPSTAKLQLQLQLQQQRFAPTSAHGIDTRGGSITIPSTSSMNDWAKLLANQPPTTTTFLSPPSLLTEAAMSKQRYESDAHRHALHSPADATKSQALQQPHNHTSDIRFRYSGDMTTVNEYTLHVLFTSFISRSEDKLNDCITEPLNLEPNIDEICGRGADPAFDQLLVAMGHIAKENPKPLIDSLMLWRKHKYDVAALERDLLQQSMPQPPPQPPLLNHSNPDSVPYSDPAHEETHRAQSIITDRMVVAAQAERRSTVSIYILCRVLLEVISQCTRESITREMRENLEMIIFSQLKFADTDHLLESPLKLANWNLFAQLLGVMSEINFQGVTLRFIEDLDSSLQELSSKNPMVSQREIEGGIVLVLGGMKHLRIKTSPAEAWNESCEFFLAMGRLFSKANGRKVKSAFCQMVDILLMPIAATASNANLASAKWSHVLAAISPKAGKMFTKPRYWTMAFPLTATMLCTEPAEKFSSQWLSLIASLSTRIKERASSPTCLEVISRLLWTYVYRIRDANAQSRSRKLDEVLKLVLPPGRRSFAASDAAVVEPLVQIIRIITFKDPDYGFKNIIFPLVDPDNMAAISSKELQDMEESKLNGPGVKLDQLDTDRVVVGIRAFLYVIGDFEQNKKPPFPVDYRPLAAQDPAASVARLAVPSTFLVNTDLSRSVVTDTLPETVRGYCSKFSQALGKITLVCNNAIKHGLLEDKIGSPTGFRTPMHDSFSLRRDEHPSYPATNQKQGISELLHVSVQALPRCLPLGDVPFSALIRLLCTGTSSPQPAISHSSAQSLRAIARQSHAHQVTIGFSNFLFSPGREQESTFFSGMLGAAHVENTLRLYVELLGIWIDELRANPAGRPVTHGQVSSGEGALNETTTRHAPVEPPRGNVAVDTAQTRAELQQIEAHALFFLLSQARRVRRLAILMLRLLTQLELALGLNTFQDSRLLNIMVEKGAADLVNYRDESLTVAERSRLERGLQNSSDTLGSLIALCTSDISYDSTLWVKVLPNLSRVMVERCASVVSLCRDIVCEQIRQMYPSIVTLSEPSRGLHPHMDPAAVRAGPRSSATTPDVVVEQWKLYVMFACTTLQEESDTVTTATANTSSHYTAPSYSSRSPKSAKTSTRKIDSGRVLFKFLIPLLQATSSSVRESVVVAMGCIHKALYKPLLEELKAQVAQVNADTGKWMQAHQRTNSSPRRNSKMDLLRTEITHVFKLTTHFLAEPDVRGDEWVLGMLCEYTRELKDFLLDGEVQTDWEFQRLRRYYCGLVQELFEGIKLLPDSSRWVRFEERKAAFDLMLSWSGLSPSQPQFPRFQQATMSLDYTEQHQPQAFGYRGPTNAAMEIEKRDLRTAALSAMATLCSGPLSVTTDSGLTLSFDAKCMMTCIEAIFSAGNDRMNMIGMRALKNLLVHNLDYPMLLQHSIRSCYHSTVLKVFESHFSVIADVLEEHPGYPVEFWRPLCLCLFTLGCDQSNLRLKAAHLLRRLDERQGDGRTSKIQDLDIISIADKTKSVYKHAQSVILTRLAKQYQGFVFHVFSELTSYFAILNDQLQRDVVAVLLPWLQNTELKVGANGAVTAPSYMLLANLVEMTVKSSGSLDTAAQSLWQALITGPYHRNVRVAMDFIVALCLERREQNYVEYAKQIAIFLSSKSAVVAESLLLNISPRNMAPCERTSATPPPCNTVDLPYCADLAQVLPTGTKQACLSLGQLSLILLVDLIVSPVLLAADSAPILLHAVAVLWDHYTSVVQEQAREMLVHLIHALLLTKVIADEQSLNQAAAAKESLQKLIRLIRRQDHSVMWKHTDNNGKGPDAGFHVPPGMDKLTSEIVDTFGILFPAIKEQWARLALTWATSCPVRHIACRSFQVFRCIMTTSLDQAMLGDLLARLSSLVADEDTEIQAFAMETLATLKTLIAQLDASQLISFPSLFWTTVACLGSINEREYLQALEMLNIFLSKLDFRSQAVRKALLEGRPTQWEGGFEGLQSLVQKGLRSANCFDAAVDTIDRLIQLPRDSLVGDMPPSLFSAILVTWPRIIHEMEQNTRSTKLAATAKVLRDISEKQGLTRIAMVLDGYVAFKYRDVQDFNSLMFASLKEAYLPTLDFQLVTFLMGLLTNRHSWVKLTVMRILRIVLPEIDMEQPAMASHGSDLISPLLRLLRTEHCLEALAVLGCITAMSASSNDRHHLRMSMTMSTSGLLRREFESLDNLFGIPESSGWAVALPGKKTEVARANIRAVFDMCHDAQTGSSVGHGRTAEVMEVATIGTPELERHYRGFAPFNYFPALLDSNRTETMMISDYEQQDPTFNDDLVAKLDALDDFFDDEPPPPSPMSQGRSSKTITELSLGLPDTSARVYDEQTLPILHQATSNASASLGAFQSVFSDRFRRFDRPVMSKTMNPGAFSMLSTESLVSPHDASHHQPPTSTPPPPPPPPPPPRPPPPPPPLSLEGTPIRPPPFYSRSVTSPILTPTLSKQRIAPARSLLLPLNDGISDDDHLSDGALSDSHEVRPGTAGATSTTIPVLSRLPSNRKVHHLPLIPFPSLTSSPPMAAAATTAPNHRGETQSQPRHRGPSSTAAEARKLLKSQPNVTPTSPPSATFSVTPPTTLLFSPSALAKPSSTSKATSTITSPQFPPFVPLPHASVPSVNKASINSRSTANVLAPASAGGLGLSSANHRGALNGSSPSTSFESSNPSASNTISTSTTSTSTAPINVPASSDGGTGSFFLENMIKSTRSGMRRLTGGKSRDGSERQRELFSSRSGASQTAACSSVAAAASAVDDVKAAAAGSAGVS